MKEFIESIQRTVNKILPTSGPTAETFSQARETSELLHERLAMVDELRKHMLMFAVGLVRVGATAKDDFPDTKTSVAEYMAWERSGRETDTPYLAHAFQTIMTRNSLETALAMLSTVGQDVLEATGVAYLSPVISCISMKDDPFGWLINKLAAQPL